MRLVTQADISSFVADKPLAAIHFDAEWDLHRSVMRSKMEQAEKCLADVANFGEVDCGRDPELAKSIPILNIPTIAYYREGKLIGAIIGAAQDVRLCLERLLRREPIR